MSVLSVRQAVAEEASEGDVYLCELGLQAGLGYYVGDATSHIFNNVREAAGVQFRYKFDQRWALQLKAQTQNIAFPLQPETKKPVATNRLYSIDAMGEFNFFRLGAKQYDERVHPFTPYIFLGVGLSMYRGVAVAKKQDAYGEPMLDAAGNAVTEAREGTLQGAAYIPFGIGLKWKFAKWCGLNVAWQQNLYFADNLENKTYYNNTHQLNKSNILKNDFTSSFTIGIVFEFSKKDKICRHCD